MKQKITLIKKLLNEEFKLNENVDYNKIKDKAYKWWSSLSLNQMKSLKSKHPYYKNFDMDYLYNKKHYYVELYVYFILKDKDYKKYNLNENNQYQNLQFIMDSLDDIGYDNYPGGDIDQRGNPYIIFDSNKQAISAIKALKKNIKRIKYNINDNIITFYSFKI